LFERTMAVAAAAATEWDVDAPDPGPERGCCSLCFDRYRVLVLCGPLQGLPHAVAHAVVEAVHALIVAQVSVDPSPSGDRGEESAHRAAFGALLLVALEELGDAEAHLAALRRRFTEPAVQAYLERHRAEDRLWADD
jgi:hypothetical protein